MSSDIWDFDDPFGIKKGKKGSSKPKKKNTGMWDMGFPTSPKDVSIKGGSMFDSGAGDANLDYPMGRPKGRKAPTTIDAMQETFSMFSGIQKKEKDPQTIKSGGKTLYQDPDDSQNYITEEQWGSRKKSTRKKKASNVVQQAVGAIKKYQDKRKVKKMQPHAHYDKKKSRNTYQITVTHENRSFTEIYNSPNEAYNAQSQWRGRGAEVSRIQMI